MDKIRVLIVDDNARLRQELARVLSSDESLEIVGEAADGNEAVQQARALKPHAVVMDLNMPVSDGVDATRRMQAEMRDVPVLILTVSDAEADLVRALAAGARGYLLKNEDAQQIKQAIHYVIRGGTLMSPLMADKLRLELEKLGPAVDETAARTQQAREAETVEEKAVAPAKKPRRDEGTRKASPDGPQDFVSDVDLLISPPIQPGAVLRFHRWLGEVPKGRISSIDPSLEGDTVISVTFEEPVPLNRMLDECDDVASAANETRSKGRGFSVAGIRRGHGADDPEVKRERKRIRVVLTAR